MDITDRTAREELLAWAKRVADLLKQRGDEAGVQAVAEALQQDQDARFMLPVLGTAKRGKSTLVNALLGRRDDAIAPVGEIRFIRRVCTWTHASLGASR